MFTMQELHDCLHVEQLDNLLFRGTSLPLPLPKLYGGQILAQALNAAARTVNSERYCHSLHGYFLRPGDDKRPIIFDVDPIRDGGSFTTRRVVAKQNGKAIFNCALSFQRAEEGLEHQYQSPDDDVPQPESLEVDEDLFDRMEKKHPGMRRPLAMPREVVDVRRITADTPVYPEVKEAAQGFWFKYQNTGDDSQFWHQTLLTYISDLTLMGTGFRPHSLGSKARNMLVASLDHALWFHTEVRVDDWVLYQMDSPRAAHSRGFNRGSFYNRKGELIASSAQEGLMRMMG